MMTSCSLEGFGLVILGCGGHARSVADVALANYVREVTFVDPEARVGEQLFGYPVLKSFNPKAESCWVAFSASGDGRVRHEHCRTIDSMGLKRATVLSSSATFGADCKVGAGSFVAHHAHVGPMARVGECVIVNTGAVVEHECEIGSFTHVSVNATVAGRCRIGCYSMIGAGATVVDGVSVTDGVVIGAGAVVIESILVPGVYVGVPARRVG